MRHLIACALAAGLFVTGCGQKPVEHVTDAIVRLPAVTGSPGAAYFILHGGPAENRLMNVSSPQVIRVELHDNIMAGGMMKMTPLDAGVTVTSGGQVAFTPGGKHAMLFDINPAVKAGGAVELRFAYANGRTISAIAKVVAAGDVGTHEH